MSDIFYGSKGYFINPKIGKVPCYLKRMLLSFACSKRNEQNNLGNKKPSSTLEDLDITGNAEFDLIGDQQYFTG